MSRQTSLWVIGVGTLGAAIGFAFGNLVAAPPAPGASNPPAIASAPSEPATREAIDVARLASALGEQLGATALREELVDTLRQELRAELRAALEEELAQAVVQAGPKRPSAHMPPPLSEAEREEQERALASAQFAFDDVRARGRFDPQSRDELMALLPSLDPDAQYELSRQLAVALNKGEIEFDDPSELPFF